jgi:hypothetical protein
VGQDNASKSDASGRGVSRTRRSASEGCRLVGGVALRFPAATAESDSFGAVDDGRVFFSAWGSAGRGLSLTIVGETDEAAVPSGARTAAMAMRRSLTTSDEGGGGTERGRSVEGEGGGRHEKK